MNKLVIGVVVVLALVFASAGGAGKKPKLSDYTPEQIAAMIADDSGTQPTSKVGVRVSPGQVKKAVDALKAKPGSQVDEEGSLDDPFQETVGIAAAGESYSTLAVAADVCFSRTDLNFSRGQWPTNRGVTEYRLWCAHGVGGPQYYRATEIDTQSAVCDTTSKNKFLVSGGNGYRYAVVRTEAWFRCGPLNTVTRQEWSCNTWGNCARVWDNDWAWWE